MGFSHALRNSPPDCSLPSLCSGRAFESRHSFEIEKADTVLRRYRLFGRSDGIRTHGLLVPNQARYQLRYTPKKNPQQRSCCGGWGWENRTPTNGVRVRRTTIMQIPNILKVTRGGCPQRLIIIAAQNGFVNTFFQTFVRKMQSGTQQSGKRGKLHLFPAYFYSFRFDIFIILWYISFNFFWMARAVALVRASPPFLYVCLSAREKQSCTRKKTPAVRERHQSPC